VARETKNRLPLAGSGAEAVRDAITSRNIALPAHLRRSVTWDQSAEMSQHAKLTSDSGLQEYISNHQPSLQRSTKENTNGLLGQYFPKRHAVLCAAMSRTTVKAKPADQSRGQPVPSLSPP